MVRKIQLPTVVVHGACDEIVPEACGRWLASRIPGAWYVSVPQAGHALLHTAPHVVADAIRRVADAN